MTRGEIRRQLDELQQENLRPKSKLQAIEPRLHVAETQLALEITDTDRLLESIKANLTSPFSYRLGNLVAAWEVIHRRGKHGRLQPKASLR